MTKYKLEVVEVVEVVNVCLGTANSREPLDGWRQAAGYRPSMMPC